MQAFPPQQTLIDDIHQRLSSLSEERVRAKPRPEKWSKKEILGHLCDSAINNYYRFMHLQSGDEPFVVVRYRQDFWVELANYQERPWEEIVQLWYQLNGAIVRIVGNSLAEHKDRPVLIDGQTFTYAFLVEDYFRHLQHHLDQILDQS